MTEAKYPHPARSPKWLGRPRQYQSEAQHVYAMHYDRPVLPWSWIVTECGDPMCLVVECMTLFEPKQLAYPTGVCVYCGDPAGTKDHLLPKPLTGDALRGRVLVVPACGNCNSRINDFPSACITDRREKAHASIRRTSKDLLAVPDKNIGELRHLGPTLRSVALKNNRKRAWIRGRLAWPEDPYYDLRAFQQSGIDDPVALGLIRGVDHRRTA